MTRERLEKIRTEMESGGSAYDYFWEMYKALDAVTPKEDE